MEITRQKELTEKQKRDIIKLWNEEYPKALSLSGLSAFEDYLQSLSDLCHLLLIDEADRVKGWLIYFIREDEKCFAMLLHASLQGKGYGSRLLDHAKIYNSVLNGWVVDNDDQSKQNGSNYRSPLGFYKKNGFEIIPDIQFKKNIPGIRVRWQARR